MSSLARASATSAEGSKLVERLLVELRVNLDNHTLSKQRQQALLEQLKVLGRSPDNSAAIFARDGIATLCAYAFDSDDLDIAREASRCLANAMLLREQPRQYLVDLGYPGKAAKRLENDDRDDEFLLSRIIFLLTYKTTVDLVDLVKEHNLAKSICRNIAFHARRIKGTATSPNHPMNDMALSESLKLLFNITFFQPSLVSTFSTSVPSIFDVLVHSPLHELPLEPPTSTTINALLNLELSESNSFSATNTDRLIAILSQSVSAYSEADLDTKLMALVTLLRKYLAASDLDTKASLKAQLLPSDEAREKPLGKDDTLPSRLLRLSASPNVLDLGKNLSALLFELSDSDPAKFIHNIGYGHAAGFLATNQIEVPQEAMGQAAAASANGAVDVNPVTGQWRDREEDADLPEMTEDEKEREAERLYVLFERLRATGVVNVENPVTRARNEGRFEEIE